METTVLVDRLRFPESPRWREGRLWFSDFSTQKVMHTDLQGNLQAVVDLPDLPSGLGWTPDGQMHIVLANARQLVRLESDEMVEVADLSSLSAYPCNDMVIDHQGRAYIANLGFDFGNPQAVPGLGSILLVTPDGKATTAAGGLAFPNGLAITPDGQTLIVAESHAACLTAFSIEPDGALGPGQVWAQFENSSDNQDGQITPDGICLDAEGAAWVASPNTREVVRVQKGAEILQRIPLSTIPLACMLGGPDRRVLFIATTESLDPGELETRGRIETIRVGVPGAGLP